MNYYKKMDEMTIKTELYQSKKKIGGHRNI
jgi:hypothetical protein